MEKSSVKKLIFIPYAEIEGGTTGANISNRSNRQEIYLKNCAVALTSARRCNDCDVALVTNIDVPEKYAKLLGDNDIKIFKYPFDKFQFNNEFKWQLAFYKLCALHYMVNDKKYDFYSYLDTDVYVQQSFDNIWLECEQNIMLYDINHGLQVPDYRSFLSEVEVFLGNNENITHFGGEFFAASRENAQRFLDACTNVYDEMISRGISTTKGDEFIISIVAHGMRALVKNAGAYIYRFWTGAGFRLVSTCYQFNQVAILHVPAEKERGIITLYNRYISKGKKVKNETVYKKLHLKRPNLVELLKKYIKKVLGR